MTDDVLYICCNDQKACIEADVLPRIKYVELLFILYLLLCHGEFALGQITNAIYNFLYKTPAQYIFDFIIKRIIYRVCIG